MPTSHPTGDLDPFFVVDWTPLTAADDLTADQRVTTYWDVEAGHRGPDPVPSWVVQDSGAIDTELGVLKTGKEADVFLVERSASTPGTDASCLLAAKRYRDADHRSFHRSAVYAEGRGVRRSRDQRALARGTAYGRAVAAGRWAQAEWEAMCHAWEAGVHVPYPVSLEGTELLMEFVGEPSGAAAPRLAQVRGDHGLLVHLWEQTRDVVLGLAEAGWAHGDLSAYNLLVQGETLVVIDLPQVVDLVANPQGAALLHRDCANVARWFTQHGVAADGEELFAEAVVLGF
ncbi:serine/threonine protein kinase [Serinicoccus hydrothermalis]|uniref:non-specific serine/threonine protein kinase n=1 Tax=Serinicoccus hydrothermalis TaxID=1758689 RepID=A0A1B1N950_9MICO|nr:RIO1 family regulatory kinase/ATPase [Serinicoccus hydrothermalis]ANS77959.1 serine/threonine protein kinase [Serinicoccus hydrothermalis]